MKNIIPAIASTNAIIAAACALEALKLLTVCSSGIENYMMYALLTKVCFSTSGCLPTTTSPDRNNAASLQYLNLECPASYAHLPADNCPWPKC